VFRTYIETIETNRTVSKQNETTRNFHKNTKICSLSNCVGWSSVCFGSIETSKLSLSVKKRNNRNKLFRNKPKQTEKNRKNRTFPEKNQNMLHIKLFRLIYCLFRFNRNMENLCFGVEAKQPKQTFVSNSAETSFGCFESKLVSKDTLTKHREEWGWIEHQQPVNNTWVDRLNHQQGSSILITNRLRNEDANSQVLSFLRISKIK
jgi:hypothetical protein